MRRGLIAWSHDEVPSSALDARVAKLQGAMRAADLDALLVYCSFPRSAAVAWLTHFVAYWNEALLAVFTSGAPVLLAAFSKRVHPWIREVSHVGEVRAASDLGRATSELLEQRLAGLRKTTDRVGVVELDALPWRIAEPVARTDHVLVDATALFAAVRQPADAIEVALAQRAGAIARLAIDSIPASVRRASDVLATVERAARLEGAEDVMQRLAPDLGTDATLRRFESDAPLGERWALEITLAYKAATVRVARSFSSSGTPASWSQAMRWFTEAAPRVNVQSPPTGAPRKVDAWRLDASVGTAPLETLASDSVTSSTALPRGALAVVSSRLTLADGPWYVAEPVLVGERLLVECK